MRDPLDYQSAPDPAQSIAGSLIATIFGILSAPAVFFVQALIAVGATAVSDQFVGFYYWTTAWFVFAPPLLALFCCLRTSRRLENNIAGVNALLLPVATFAGIIGLIASTCMLMCDLSGS